MSNLNSFDSSLYYKSKKSDSLEELAKKWSLLYIRHLFIFLDNAYQSDKITVLNSTYDSKDEHEYDILNFTGKINESEVDSYTHSKLSPYDVKSFNDAVIKEVNKFSNKSILANSLNEKKLPVFSLYDENSVFNDPILHDGSFSTIVKIQRIKKEEPKVDKLEKELFELKEKNKALSGKVSDLELKIPVPQPELDSVFKQVEAKTSPEDKDKLKKIFNTTKAKANDKNIK